MAISATDRAAAIFERRCGTKNSKVLSNLGAFAVKARLFDHGNHCDEDDWEDYERRVQAEQQSDMSDLSMRSVQTRLTPQQLLRTKAQDHLEQLIDKEQPFIRIAAEPEPIAFTDPNSVNFRDPSDFFRTTLIKAAIDNDTALVLELVEQGASLYIRDVEGNDALANAVNFGSTEAEELLLSLISQNPQKAVHLRSA